MAKTKETETEIRLRVTVRLSYMILIFAAGTALLNFLQSPLWAVMRLVLLLGIAICLGFVIGFSMDNRDHFRESRELQDQLEKGIAE